MGWGGGAVICSPVCPVRFARLLGGDGEPVGDISRDLGATHRLARAFAHTRDGQGAAREQKKLIMLGVGKKRAYELELGVVAGAK